LLGLGVLRGRDVLEVAEVAVALAIAVVPEGLPAVATLTLAVGMRRMAADNALVRRLPAVETLGSTTVVCSDKTGTLTRNDMEVTRVRLADDAAEDDLWVSASLCNDADVDPDGDPVGDPTEVALLHAATRQEIGWRDLRARHDREREVPFDSSTKRMAVVAGGVVHVKGAPEVLLDQPDHGRLLEAAEEMAADALRTLVVARRPAPAHDVPDEGLFDDLEVLAVVGMRDPPRDSATHAIDTLHAAGIRTVMITGDRPDTARAIASGMGLSRGDVLTGEQLAALSTEEVADAVAGVEVFARVEPAQKLAIIEALQEAGEVVAVTGDGVNDAPALRHADVGVAMGGGTDVAREAADIVLLDDRFDTIEVAVQEGRRIFDNIRRFAQFLFSWHVAEVAVIALSVLVGFPAPLAGLMILWNNLVIDVLPSFALALEPSRADAMDRPPRDPSESLLDRGTLRRLLVGASLVAVTGLAAFTVGRAVLDLDVPASQTMTFLTMSAGQVLTVFNVRTDRGSGFRGASGNPWLWGALATTAVLEGIALAVAPLRDLLGLTTLSGMAWLVAAGLALVPLLVVQAFRTIRDR
jgi:Ca2+-transporting ATPase